MPKDFIPSRDADLLAWAQDNSALITATPTAFGLTAAIATAYAALVTTYATKFDAASNPNSRTRVQIAEKVAARRALVESARSWARMVQAFPGITVAQRLALGISPRDVGPTPINAPTTPPTVLVKQALGRQMMITLRSTETQSRAKPAGVAGAVVFTYIGAEPAANPDHWTYQGQVTRTNFEIVFPSSVPAGSRVWITAAWYSPRGQTSELCDPVSAYVAGGIASAVELNVSSDSVELKQAA